MGLTKILGTFLGKFADGGARLQPEALWLLATFFSIELVIVGIWFMFRRELDWWALVQKVITAGIFTWLIKDWSTITRLLAKGFIQAGLLVGGDGVVSYTDFTDPDNIASYGLSVTAVLMQHLSGPDYTGLNAVKNLLEIVLSGLTAWTVVLVYIGIGVWVFLTLLEFYLSSAITIILLPWGMLTKTAFLAEKAIAYVFASGIRLLVLATIFGAVLPVMFTAQQGLTVQGGIAVSLKAAMNMLGTALALGFLSWRANSIAQGFVHGSPALALSDATQAFQVVTRHLTSLGSVLQGLAHTLAPSASNNGGGSSSSTTTTAPSRRAP